jgi:hypothetical protein
MNFVVGGQQYEDILITLLGLRLGALFEVCLGIAA